MSGFSYTPGEDGAIIDDPWQHRPVNDDDREDAARQYTLATTWKPPAGHATWCEVQLPPPWRHSHVGSTPMAARGGCTCGRSKAAKLARRRELRALMESIGRKVA